ncbi:MAG TPA: primosomal protein N' [Patescibacteria group bacterium]|nr:primosomal protein N' [Patescibacteria group bacterium]
MNYYEVIPAGKNFHGREPLTYHHADNLDAGQIVFIKLRNTKGLGIVMGKIKKPSFDTNDIESVSDLKIPDTHVSLLEWMMKFYPGALGATAQLFAPSLLGNIKESAIDNKKSFPRPDLSKLPKLTDEQKAAHAKIIASSDTTILHGVTGSGKTRLYIEIANQIVTKNKSVIILTPEISLTTPIANQFKAVFGDRVEISHSSLTPKQKSSLWQRVSSNTNPLVIVGPRSSLFLPLKNIGLIIVDEFHETAYKQESQPYYHANRVASMLAKSSGSRLIFGSATPSINDYYIARRKNIPIAKMLYPAITGKVSSLKPTVVDMTDPVERTPYSLLSKSLISAIEQTLSRSEQAMLFINKRGSARSICCQECGHRELCKNCDLPMVYHGDQHLIRCHTCGFHINSPTKCAVCGSSKIFFTSPGTKAIEESLSKLFPQANISRFDKDNKKAERLENIYKEASENVDIIVGTQTITKGHDLPRLALVAMLLADSNLAFPDFSAEERSYQLIKQLSGRVNRGHRAGIFLVQTFDPASKLISSIMDESWDNFFEAEIAQRKKHGFPPFYSALKVESSRKSRKSAENSLVNLIDKLDIGNMEILGPSPSFIEKKSSMWHWQVIIKSKNRTELSQLARDIPSSFKADVDPINFL